MPTWLVTAFFNWILGKISELVLAAWKKVKRNKEIDQKAQESVEPLKKAETKEEIDEAAVEALRHL